MLYLAHEDGQGLVEYALILVLVAIVVIAILAILKAGGAYLPIDLVAIVVIAILAILGPQIGNVFSQITNTLAGT